jgi:hypothetical protein
MKYTPTLIMSEHTLNTLQNSPNYVDISLPDIIKSIDLSPTPEFKYTKYLETNDFNSLVNITEFLPDMEKILIKSNITNLLTLAEDCDEPIEAKKMINMIKNSLILHTKLKNMPEFIKSFEESLVNSNLQQEHHYDILVIYKMLWNIQKGKLSDNIHFRYVEENVRKYPPIPEHERLLIERKVKYITYSYQAKKKHDAFRVGQIVGAKDKENKWWLSRVLHVFNDEERAGYWYYIRFEGWGVLHDEWIYSETYRVRYYNSRKHFLKK